VPSRPRRSCCRRGCFWQGLESVRTRKASVHDDFSITPPTRGWLWLTGWVRPASVHLRPDPLLHYETDAHGAACTRRSRRLDEPVCAARACKFARVRPNGFACDLREAQAACADGTGRDVTLLFAAAAYVRACRVVFTVHNVPFFLRARGRRVVCVLFVRAQRIDLIKRLHEQGHCCPALSFLPLGKGQPGAIRLRFS